MKIEVLFPEFCNLFGDAYNMVYLEKTLPEAEFIRTKFSVYMGPMTERMQEQVIRKLMPLKEKIQKAIDKIDQEAEKMGGATVRLLCSHIIDHCLVNDENADKVLDEGKSLKGCWDHITSNARKQAAGNCAAVPDDTVYEWAAGYYGFTAEETKAEIIDLLDLL